MKTAKLKSPSKLQSDAMPTTLIFDGDCSFCTTSAQWLQRRSQVSLEIIPWQFADLTSFGLTAGQTAKRVYLQDVGRLYSGHHALAQLLRIQPRWWWRLLGGVLVFPLFSWFFAIGYSLVARYRHRLPGGTPACAMPRK